MRISRIPSLGAPWRSSVMAALTTIVTSVALLAMSLFVSIGASAAPSQPTMTLPQMFDLTGAAYANELGYTGDGIDIALIDTGINAVPGLAARGKVIDGVDLSFNSSEENLRYRDLHGHGTNMAGIIAAEVPEDGYGLAMGMAPGARLINVKVGAADGSVDVSQVIAGIDWVIANKNADGMNIRVISLSYGTDAGQDYRIDPLAHAVENAWRHGIVVVVAAGNLGSEAQHLVNPALDPYVIAVGASETDTKIPAWSSTGNGVRNPDIVAPGVGVVGLRVPGSYLDTTYPEARWSDGNETYFRGSGTSQAAAAVAGLTALLLEAHPTYSPDDIKALFKATAEPIRDHSETRQGKGVVDVEAALKYSLPLGYTTQSWAPSTGLGTLEDARGSANVGLPGQYLEGEHTAFASPWNPDRWATASSAGTAWTGATWSGVTWSGATWSGVTWSGVTWSGVTWSGVTWSGVTWSGVTWSGVTWSGVTWSGVTWSGVTWSGVTWSGVTWSSHGWS